jgi:glycine/D-amino acid oxidase-like deaminating enzyme
MNKKYDVLIVGAGIIGSAIAYFLSQEKIKVGVIEKGNIGEEASSACGGIVFLQSKKPGINLKLALESIHILKQLQDEFERDIEYEQNGGLVIVTSEVEKKVLSQMAKEYQMIGLKVQWLDTKETLEIEPFLSKEILGSTFCQLDGSINPIALTLAFAETAIKNGVNLYPSTEIENFIYENKHIIGITSTKQEQYFADQIVLATGIYSNQLLSKIKIQLPMKPRRGQEIVTEPIAPLLNHALLSGRYLAAKLYPEILQDLTDPLNKMGIGLVIEQTKSGNLLMGSTREFVGENKEITFPGIEYILKHATSIIPSLKDINIIRTFSGLRPYTIDGLPIISKLDPFDNLIIATGHEGDGIALSAITGKIVKKMVLEEQLSYNMDKLDLRRFDKIENIIK